MTLTVCLYIVLSAVALFMVLPFVWMVSVSLRETIPYSQHFLGVIPKTITFRNYIDTWNRASFSLYFLNTSIFAVGSTALTLFFSALAGYTLAELQFPGRKALFLMILFSMMLPEASMIIPRFIVVKSFPFIGGNNLRGQGGIGLINTYPGLILPFAVTGFGIFLCRQFFSRIPNDLRDSGKIDGCGEFRIFWQIMLPLAKPALVALAIFTFTWRWNKLLWPLVATQGKNMRVLAVGLTIFLEENRSIELWTALMAASTIAIIPIVVLFFLLQKHFVRGIHLSGLKG